MWHFQLDNIFLFKITDKKNIGHFVSTGSLNIFRDKVSTRYKCPIFYMSRFLTGWLIRQQLFIIPDNISMSINTYIKICWITISVQTIKELTYLEHVWVLQINRGFPMNFCYNFFIRLQYFNHIIIVLLIQV